MLHRAYAAEIHARWQFCLFRHDFVFVKRTGIKHQAARVLPRLPAKRADNTALEDKSLAILVEEVSTFTDNENSMFSLKPDFCAPLKAITQADRINLSAQSRADFTKAQAADSFCQTTVREAVKDGTDCTINKDGVLVYRALSKCPLQMLVL